MYYRVWVASQRFHGTESLTYSSRIKLMRGQIISVPLQRQSVIGIVDSITNKPGFQTKPIAFAWPLTIPGQALKLLTWLTDYYPAPLGALVELFTPPALIKNISPVESVPVILNIQKLPPLTSEQQRIFKLIEEDDIKSVLLHGDTGTGKTRVYLELAIQTVQSGRSCLILTPEIGLTEQLRTTFEEVFGKHVLITHSDMSPVQRREIWHQICTAAKPLIVIGPRSAVFTPLSNIGLVVMDEAHDGAYKQEQAPYYQTSRVAAQLAHLHAARFIMGTATPLTTDYFVFQQKKLPILRMTDLALPQQTKVIRRLIDYRDHSVFNRSPWLSMPLLNAIDEALERQEQALLFLNRRGSARLVLCSTCGWQAVCPHCDVALTYHQDQHIMRCHSCNFVGESPNTCPVCGATEIIFRSIGTKALEAEIIRLYPNACIARFDRDTEKSLRLSRQYQDLRSGRINILIGTQTIAKGIDLPKLSVVGIVQADSGLQIPDYTSNERTYQLISQVSGRVGRGHLPGKLFIQSFQSESPLITRALSRDYSNFYEQELAERKLFKFPPYYFLLKISCSRASSASAQKACIKIASLIAQTYSDIVVEGPAPRFIEKISGQYGWHLVIKSISRTKLLAIIKKLPGNCTYDIDPSDLL